MKECTYNVLTIRKADGSIDKTVGFKKKVKDEHNKGRLFYTNLRTGDELSFAIGRQGIVNHVTHEVDRIETIEACVHGMLALEAIRLMPSGGEKNGAIDLYVAKNDRLLKKRKSKVIKKPNGNISSRHVTRVRGEY